MAEVKKFLRWGENARLEDRKLARYRLVEAAYESFHINGVQDTSISDVVTLAKVSRSTFYKYFSGKKDLHKAVLQHITTRLFQDLVMSVLPHAKDAGRMFEEAVVFASTYQLPVVERDGVEQKGDNDLLTLFSHNFQEDWCAGWQEAFNRIYILHYEASMPTEDLASLAELASHLVLGYREIAAKPQTIKRNLAAFRAYTLQSDSTGPSS